MGSPWGSAWTILLFYTLREIEREAHLLITAALIALHWPLSIRLLCLHCVADDLQGDAEDDEPSRLPSRHTSTSTNTRSDTARPGLLG